MSGPITADQTTEQTHIALASLTRIIETFTKKVAYSLLNISAKEYGLVCNLKLVHNAEIRLITRYRRHAITTHT